MDMTTAQIIAWGASLIALGISFASIIFSIIISINTTKDLKEINTITENLKFYVESFIGRQQTLIEKLTDKFPLPELQEKTAKDVVKEIGKELDKTQRKISDIATASVATYIGEATKQFSNVVVPLLSGAMTKNVPRVYFNPEWIKKDKEK